MTDGIRIWRGGVPDDGLYPSLTHALHVAGELAAREPQHMVLVTEHELGWPVYIAEIQVSGRIVRRRIPDRPDELPTERLS